MAIAGQPVWGTFNCPRATNATPGNAFTALIRPFSGNQFPAAANPDLGQRKGRGYSHVTKVIYTTGSTAHLVYIMRPLNYALIVSGTGSVINIATDPGKWATPANWLYDPFPGGVASASAWNNPPSVANIPIATGHWICYQGASGTWIVDTVASVATLAITMTTPLPTGGVLAGAPFYFFGAITSLDPSTGYGHPQTQYPGTPDIRDTSWSADQAGVVSNLHPGDPMIFYSGNATAQGYLEALCGFYSAY
jgi:hypothetical protein